MNIHGRRDVLTAMEQARRRGLARSRFWLRVTGAGLLVASGATHLDLYLTGYRTIPTIGELFLLQTVAAFGLGAVVLAFGSRLAAAAGAGFVLSTLGGYLFALRIGLFGFREVRTDAGIVAAVIEVAAFAALAAFALAPQAQERAAGPVAHGSRPLDRLQAGIPGAEWAIAAFSVSLVVVLGLSVAVSGSTSTGSSATLLKIGNIGGITVLTNSRGFTLYWFARDTSTESNCTGACALYWPPAIGSSAAGPGVTGKIGTIQRAQGVTQSTYDSHPLYTYAGDSAPGQANGNNITLYGGVWHEVDPSRGA